MIFRRYTWLQRQCARVQALVLWAWQAYPGTVPVPERACSMFAKSQLQQLSPSALPQTLNCNGLFDLMGIDWGICMSSPAKMEVGLCWVLKQWWSSSYTVQNTVRNIDGVRYYVAYSIVL